MKTTIKAETKQNKNNKTKTKSGEAESWSFEKINKIDELLANLMK